MYDIVFVLKNVKNNVILALRYKKVNHGVEHQMAKKLTVNRQKSKPILAVKCLRYP